MLSPPAPLPEPSPTRKRSPKYRPQTINIV
jgi:hypothetical protein